MDCPLRDQLVNTWPHKWLGQGPTIKFGSVVLHFFLSSSDSHTWTAWNKVCLLFELLSAPSIIIHLVFFYFKFTILDELDLWDSSEGCPASVRGLKNCKLSTRTCQQCTCTCCAWWYVFSSKEKTAVQREVSIVPVPTMFLWRLDDKVKV